MYGQTFFDMPLENSMEIKSFVEGSSTNVKFSSVFSRAQKLCKSYRKIFTNYYQNIDKTEEKKQEKRLKEQERRKRINIKRTRTEKKN